ncbi:hypothetical protein ACT3SZ_05785 [Corynebacterium sp. AOP40-9SA-29]|uniref:hypothetical protein n=1 Tax=Corynebacterium sp. AOP40-9SA-29 TaxID=3457677 RepID=UPI0040341DA0
MENNGIIIPEIFQKWLLPPLQLMRESFSAGGCFVRRGKGSEYSPPKNIVDLADWPSYSPFINGYIPAKMLAAEGVSDISSEPDRTEWNLRLWQSGSGARKATPAEMHYQVVPEIIFSLELFDLFIARMISSLGNDNLPIEAIDSTIR